MTAHEQQAPPRAIRGLELDWYPQNLPSGAGVEPHTVITADSYSARGVLYTPPADSGASDTVLVLMHPRVDYSKHYTIPTLISHGFAVWVQNARHAGTDLRLLHEQALLDLAAGVNRLLDLGFTRIVGLGNSGGAALMTYYQQQAGRCPGDRNQTTPAGRPSKLDTAVIPEFNAMVLLAPHLGQGEMLSRTIDPSVASEADPFSVDPELDPFELRNGYRPGPVSSRYPDDFQLRYRAAQRTRMSKLDDIAHDLLADAGEARRIADGDLHEQRRRARGQLMTVWRTDADLRTMDLGLDPSDRRYGSLFGNPVRSNFELAGAGRLTSPEAWLSTWSYHSSHASIPKTGTDVTVPVLLIEYSGDNCVFTSDFGRVVSSIASEHKTIRVVRGDHYGLPLTPGETHGGELAGVEVCAWLDDVVDLI